MYTTNANNGLNSDGKNANLQTGRINDVINNALKLNEMSNQVIDITSLDYEKYPFYGFDVSRNTTSYISKHGFKISTTSYTNNKNIDMVKILAVEGMEHNHYTEFAPNIWAFLKNFSRNTETNELIFKDPSVKPDTGKDDSAEQNPNVGKNDNSNQNHDNEKKDTINNNSSIDKKDDVTTTVNKTTENNPKTDDKTPIELLIIGCLTSIVAIIVIKKKRYFNK